jgi:glycerophosphoryl diester phosphodiesterase
MALDWLTARPVAHRGLWGGGVIENSLSAARAAIEANYAIELDLQFSADGEPVVFHDDTLERLTDETGPLGERSFSEITKIRFKGSEETIPSFAEFLETVGGRTPIIIELKSAWNGETAFARTVAKMLESYHGPVAVMSFDPAIVHAFKLCAPGLPRGIVAQRWYQNPAWDFLPRAKKNYLGLLLHLFKSQPHFVAYAQFDLPATAPLLARYLLGMPLLTWTVRFEKERLKVQRWADQIIFEHIRP